MELTSSVACSSSLGHKVEGEFLGFLYIFPSSSISSPDSSSSKSSSSSSEGVGVVLDTAERRTLTEVTETKIIRLTRVYNCLTQITSPINCLNRNNRVQGVNHVFMACVS